MPLSVLSPSQAIDWFGRLASVRRIATLSPHYVLADAARDSALEPFFIGYAEGDAFWYHGVLRGRVEEAQCWDFQSPYGYGGPVSNSDDAAFLARAWEAYTGWCAENNIMAEFVRLHPLAAAWQPYGGSRIDDRRTVSIPLTETIEAGYAPARRNKINKAERAGLCVSEKPREEIVSRFASFYREGMHTLNADAFYLFSDAYFSALAQLPGMHLLACEQDGQWLCASLFLEGGTTLEYHLSATNEQGRKLAATNLLIHKAAQWGRDRKLTQLFLGGGTDKSEDNALYQFKLGFSKHTHLFQLGFAIHQPVIYNALKEQYRQAGKLSPYVLFYRKS